MSENVIYIPGRVKSMVKDGRAVWTEDIYDDTFKKSQKELNSEMKSITDQMVISIAGGSVEITPDPADIQEGEGAVPNCNAVALKIQDALLTIDEEPTKDSPHAVSSGGVYDALQGKYEKPVAGIPSTDMTEGVQTALSKANTAIQRDDIADLVTEQGMTLYVEEALQPVVTLIPTQATPTNQLADKDFVNSSIATSTGTFRGTYQNWSEIEDIEDPKLNDYVFLETTVGGNTTYDRYKYTTTGWEFEYRINNSSFTAAQWAAINSQATQELTAKLSALPSASELNTELGGKQDVINDLSDIRSGAALGATAVQTETDPTVPSWAKQQSKPSYSYSEISGTPTNVSAFTNDAGYLTQHQDISGKVNSAVSVTYSQLVGLRTNSGLVAGQLYRITDFVTTVSSQEVEARSAGHQFDVIVRADSANTLSEMAWAARHAGDTYFANSRLEAWELKYMLDNEYWSDATNGKGVITWMKDEFDNECPYDFKNVQYKRYKVSDPKHREAIDGKYVGCGGAELIDDLTMDSSDFKWYYTFSSRDDTFITIEDFTLDEMCYSNRIERDEETHGQLSNNVFCFHEYTAHDNILKGPYSVNNSFIVDDANGNYIAGALDNICVSTSFSSNATTLFTSNLITQSFINNSIKANFYMNIIDVQFSNCSSNEGDIMMNTFTGDESSDSFVGCIFYSNEFVANTISVGTGVMDGTANFYGDMSNQTITLPDGECFVSTDSNGNLVIWNPADCPTKSEVAQTMVASQSVRNVVVLTQQEYDALSTKDNYTEYNIV